jgi:hypothetical protein
MIQAALKAKPIKGRITLSGYEGSELLVARLLVESGADVRYVGTACPKTIWSSGDLDWLEQHGVHVEYRASLEQDLAAMKEFEPDLVIGTTPVVQKAKDDLAAFQKSNQIARQQAGILEDVGTVSKTEQKAEEVPTVKESDISGAVGPAVFRTITRKGASLKEQTIKRVADAITKEWSVVPDIIVIADESELPDNLRKQAERDEMIGKIPGLYDTETKKVYLIANNLFDENDIALTIERGAGGDVHISAVREGGVVDHDIVFHGGELTHVNATAIGTLCDIVSN